MESKRVKSGVARTRGIFLVTAGVLVVSVVLTYFVGVAVIENNRTVDRERGVLQNLTNFVSTLREAETSQRGYLLTEDERYLRAYQQALATIGSAKAALRQRAEDGDLPMSEINAVIEMGNEHLAELAQMIQFRRGHGLPAALTAMRNTEGKASLDGVHVRVKQMAEKEEEKLQHARQQAATAITTRTVTFAGTIVLNLGFLSWASRRITREIREREISILETDRQKVLLATTLASIGDGVVITDVKGCVTFLNAEAERLTGWKNAEATNQSLNSVFRLVDEETRELVESPFDQVLRQRAVAGLSNRSLLIAKDGSVTPIDDSAAPICQPGAPPSGVVFVFRDFTEHRRTETALREGEARFAGMINSAMDAVIAVNAAQHIVLFNPAAEQMFGCTTSEAIGTSLDRFIPADAREAHRRHIENFGTTGVTNRRMGALGALRGVRATGEEFPLEASISHLEIGGKKLYTVILRDVTERKRAEEAVARARDEAQAANRTKDRFLAMLSHELRIPLTPALLYSTELEKSPKLPIELLKDCTAVRMNIELEARLIDDLLDMARISQGKLKMLFSECDPHVVLRRAVETVETDLLSKQISLEWRLDATQSWVSGDPGRLQQVFWNLLRNAAKFTPTKGRILLRSLVAADTWRLEVTDNGVGLAPADITRIFETFVQAEDGAKPQLGGLGLGLAICSFVVNEHHGRVWAESAGRGLGSTFVVEIPLLISAATAGDQSTDPEAEKKLRILVVEDHAPSRIALVTLLKRRGYKVVGAESVAEALTEAAANTFDLVISDIGLPDGTGLQLMKSLGQTYSLKGIALTGYGMESDISAARDAGFLLHVTKPITSHKIEDALARATEALRQG